MAEVLLGRMAVEHDPLAAQAGAQRGERRVRQHGIDVHGVGGFGPVGHDLDARALQHGALVFDRLPHPAAPHQRQRTGIEMDTHEEAPFVELFGVERLEFLEFRVESSELRV